jgi:predicted MPP superfamily phosphohydrolase
MHKMLPRESEIKKESEGLTRREFMRLGALGLTSVAFLGAARPEDDDIYEIVEQTVKIKNLPQEFDGFSIGMVSDVHSGKFMSKEDMADYVTAVNAMKTDTIMMPGDFVTSKIEEVYPFVETFALLKAPYGVYACLGNHDYYAGADTVSKEVVDCGISLLRDEAVTIKKGSAAITVAGVEDVGWNKEPRKNLERALKQRPNGSTAILLCHKPYYLDLAAEHYIDLMLSGHTHGGQFVLSRIGGLVIAPATLFSKYVAGLYKKEGSQLYVTRGIGTIVVPFRFNCPPEITKIILRKLI